MTKPDALAAALAASNLACKKKREDRIREYDTHPSKCGFCSKALTYDQHVERYKFCSKSCAAKHNNLGIRRHGKPRSRVPCPICQTLTVTKFCSTACSAQYKRNLVWAKIENGTYKTGHKQTIRLYLIAKRGRKCEKCGAVKWMGKPVPVESHHIDGNYQNNLPSNLILLCLNCHGITPNYMAKNKGNGRYSRRLRYNLGKSF